MIPFVDVLFIIGKDFLFLFVHSIYLAAHTGARRMEDREKEDCILLIMTG